MCTGISAHPCSTLMQMDYQDACVHSPHAGGVSRCVPLPSTKEISFERQTNATIGVYSTSFG